MTETSHPAPVPAALPQKSTRAQMAVQALSAGLLLWLYGVDLIDALRFPGAELAAFGAKPGVLFPGAAVLATVAAAGAAAWGHLNKLGGTWRGHRLLPIVAVVVLFSDVFVVASTQHRASASDLVMLGLEEFAQRANRLSSATSVVTDESKLQSLLADMPKPPYWVRGQRVEAYRLEVRSGCDGPVKERGQAAPGTLFYCSSPDKKEGWVTLVGLPIGSRFGTPGIVTQKDMPLAAEAKAGAQPEPEAQPSEAVTPEDLEAMGQLPMEEPTPLPGSRWGELFDGGAVAWPAFDGGL